MIYEFAVFKNIEDFNTWHSAIMLQCEYPKNKTLYYTRPVVHADGRVVCKVKRDISHVGLTVASKAWADKERFFKNDPNILKIAGLTMAGNGIEITSLRGVKLKWYWWVLGLASLGTVAYYVYEII